MPIDSTNKEHDTQVDNWKLIDDIVNETNLTDYLITLNPTDTSDENKARNVAYRERAVFYALTKQTAVGMMGTIFSKVPLFEAPKQLEYMAKNIDGRGNSIYQQSKSVSKDVTTKSRAGLFTTFPQVKSGTVSKADINSGKYVATIHHIKPSNILNWHEELVGSKSILSLVTILDSKDAFIDYELKSVPMIRELYIEDGVYNERHWIKVDDKWIVDEGPYTPTDYKSNTFSEIPFTFVGSEDNDTSVDVPMMLNMSKLNRSHYRNSADYEDSVWFVGQTQPWMSNVDQDHIDLMNNNNMYAGSRNVLAVPDGGAFGFASAPPNPAVRQAMLDKVDMMIGIGAHMITPGGVAKTAEQSGNEKAIQHSPLSLVASNVSDAYNQSLVWAGMYMGTTEEAKYEINTDFIMASATPAELKEVIAGYMSGSVPVADYVKYMKEYGIFDEEKPLDEYVEVLPAGAGEGL